MSAESTTIDNTSKEPTIEEVVESIGFGYAQVLVLMLGSGGVLFAEGAALSSLNGITVSLANDPGVPHTSDDLLTMMCYTGIAFGSAVSGVLADYGRRLPILIAFGTIAFALLLMSELQAWFTIVMSSACIGVGIGIGMPVSVAMLSELSPVRWRMRARAAAAIQFQMGFVFTSVFAIFDDPTLVHLDWRRLLQFAALPAATLFCLASAFLPESPVFLASTNRHDEAVEGFKNMAWHNGNKISGLFQTPQVSDIEQKFGVSSHLSVIFSNRLWFATLVNAFVAFSLSVDIFGCMYANPQIFVTTSSMPAAYQGLIQIAPGALTVIVAGWFADRMSRQSAVIVSLVLCIGALISTNAGGGAPAPRSVSMEILFQYGLLMNSCGLSWGVTVAVQIAAEIFPPTSAAFGVSFILGMGRLGSIIAPAFFDFTTHAFGAWQAFYAMTSSLLLVALMMWLFVNPEGGKMPVGAKGVVNYATMTTSKIETPLDA